MPDEIGWVVRELLKLLHLVEPQIVVQTTECENRNLNPSSVRLWTTLIYFVKFSLTMTYLFCCKRVIW